MRKIIIFLLLMFIGVCYVNASSENINIDIISVSHQNVTLKVNALDNNSICYLYRSDDMINFDKQILVDCNKMYVDKGLDVDTTYYYKARAGSGDVFSEMVSVTIDNIEENTLELTRDISNFANVSIIFILGFVFFMLVLIVSMINFKKRFN